MQLMNESRVLELPGSLYPVFLCAILPISGACHKLTT